MPVRLTTIAALALAPAAAAGAQPDSAGADSALATLFARDSASRLVLIRTALRFGFTERGGRQVRHAVDSAAAAHPRDTTRGAWFDGAALARGIADRVTRDLRLDVPLASVEDVRTEGATLTVCFAARAPDAPPCARDRRFVLTGASPADVRRFADAVERARAGAMRAP